MIHNKYIIGLYVWCTLKCNQIIIYIIKYYILVSRGRARKFTNNKPMPNFMKATCVFIPVSFCVFWACECYGVTFPEMRWGCGKLDKKNTCEEKKLLQDERDVMKKKRKKRQRDIASRFVRIVWRKHVLQVVPKRKLF